MSGWAFDPDALHQAFRRQRVNSSSVTGNDISSVQLERTAVYSQAGEKIGSIDDLMIEKQSGQLRHAARPRRLPTPFSALDRIMKLNRHLIAIASATLLASGLAAAQTATPTTTTAPSAMNSPLVSPGERMLPSRDRREAMKGEEVELEDKLGAGQSRAEYAKILESNGYRIAAVNADKKDYLEYEVVKGARLLRITRARM